MIKLHGSDSSSCLAITAALLKKHPKIKGDVAMDVLAAIEKAIYLARKRKAPLSSVTRGT